MATESIRPPVTGSSAAPQAADSGTAFPTGATVPAPAAARDVSGPVLDFIESLHGPTGKVLKAAYRLGGVRLLHVLVLQPLLIALLAAFWMLMLAKLPWAPAQQVRGWFVELIHEGFAVRDAAEKTSLRDNRLIDFVQIIDFELAPSTPQKAIPLLLDLNRRVRLDVKLADGHPPVCTGAVGDSAVQLAMFLKSKRAPLEAIVVDDEPEPVTLHLDAAWWQKHAVVLAPDPASSRDVAGDLVLRRSDASRPVPGCELVRGRLQISVFKTYVAFNATPTAAAAPSKP